MKTTLVIALIFATASAVVFCAENLPSAKSSAKHRKELLEKVTSEPRATSPFAARHGYVPTNTQAFQEYAFDVLIGEANRMNAAWKLGLPQPVVAEHVTHFYAVPKITGVDGTITISNRYAFAVAGGRLERFRDLDYWSGSWSKPAGDIPNTGRNTNAANRTPMTAEQAWRKAFERSASQEKEHHDKMMARAGMTNQLSESAALQVARDALRSLGLFEKQLGVSETPTVNQYKYQPPGGKEYSLPYFNVAWHFESEEEIEPVVIEVSGITKQVASYFNVMPAARTIPVPTNYFQILGISPIPRLWGKQFGYDPLNTAEFQDFARQFLLEKAQWLLEAWNLNHVDLIRADLLNLFQALPFTNTFIVSAQITNRFSLQIGEQRIQLFTDEANHSGAFTDSKSKMQSLMREKNQLTKSSALDLARKAIEQIGMDEKKLHLPKPQVIQLREAYPDETKLHELPFYNVQWIAKDAEYPTIAVQVSGITKTVTRLVNNCTNVTNFSLPTNYQSIIGIAPNSVAH